MKCSKVYDLFFQPGEVCEIRAYGLSRASKDWEGWAGGAGIVYGYFDNAAAFGQAAESLERHKAPGIYFTLNPVVPELLARAANRLRAADMKSPTTADDDILCLRWLPIDLDPKRPTGISSTDQEIEEAKKLARKIAAWLATRECVDDYHAGFSGNGIHLVYRLPDLVNSEESRELVRDLVIVLAARFTTAKVEVDQKVFNPARIWKLYGTTARKGDHTSARPHRKSYLLEDI